MSDQPIPPHLRLDPVPLAPEAERRIRSVIRHEARSARLALAEAALHGGFALAAVVWAVAAVLG
ncbi:MAG: hypothetical protein Q8P18_27980 [Pseudomonadota bacterium]|nr:hypothetical protein [Pseudomonadota bacterium]